jgi:hypothetical protein
MVEPVQVPDKLKKLVSTLEALNKGKQAVAAIKEPIKSVPLTNLKPK